MSSGPFNQLVKLVARAFYDDKWTEGDKQTKNKKSDRKGFSVVVLEALTRRQWVRKEDLAKDLKLNSTEILQALQFLEKEKLVARCERRETAKGAKLCSDAAAVTADGHPTGRDGDRKIKLLTHYYFCLDYAQIYDVVRYRLHHMKKKLKDELENKNTVQEYICPNCRKRYDALDAPRLFSPDDEFFHCENCNGELVAKSHKLATQENGDDKLKYLLQKMEVQFKPLMDQLSRVKDLPVPEFGSLQTNAAACAAIGDSRASDPSKSSQGVGFSGTQMPFFGETKVEVSFSGIEVKEESIKSEGANLATKPLPPWMIKQGMNLTEEQRGEVKQEARTEVTSAAVDSSDDNKATTEQVDAKYLQDEFVKAYYAALLQRQREQAAATKREQELSNSSVSNGINGRYLERQVGMKSKRDDVEWEEAPPAGNTGEICKVKELNVVADALGDEEDIDWEEG